VFLLPRETVHDREAALCTAEVDADPSVETRATATATKPGDRTRRAQRDKISDNFARRWRSCEAIKPAALAAATHHPVDKSRQQLEWFRKMVVTRLDGPAQ
jgi:mannose/cellobiose epimerase-like protein (N-acyl-D-glucosamine 2-epimerase family)